jgi:polyhydroxybutyrate depolymerase
MAKLFVETLLVALIFFVGLLVYYMNYHEENAFEGKQVAKSAGENVTVADDREHFLTHQGRQRRYLVHVPKTREPGQLLPVVLNFHGAGGRAEAQRTLSRTNAVADVRGFLVVYPDGTGRSRILSFNAGGCCGYAVQEKVDDVGFVGKLLDELPAHYPVDTRRIYATGISNGAMLCYRLACEMADRIAAIGPVAGAMQVDGPQPQRPVPVIHFHGMKDPVAHYAGGKGPYAGVQHRPVEETIAWWINANHCRPEAVEVTQEKDFIARRYAPADGAPGAPVVLYSLPEGGHTWPGGVDLTPHLGTGTLIQTVDATTLMWKFFQQFSLESQ